MSTIQLNEGQVGGLVAPHYGRVGRDGAAYKTTETWAVHKIQRCLDDYDKIEILDQSARLIRDDIEQAIRRFQDYTYEYRLQLHYRDASIPFTITDKSGHGLTVEHVIPVRYLVAGVIQRRIPIKAALHAPMCLIRNQDNDTLNKHKLTKTTPDPYWFWRRYQCLSHVDIITNRKDPVDMNTWNFQTHLDYFKISE